MEIIFNQQNTIFILWLLLVLHSWSHLTQLDMSPQVQYCAVLVDPHNLAMRLVRLLLYCMFRYIRNMVSWRLVLGAIVAKI